MHAREVENGEPEDIVMPRGSSPARERQYQEILKSERKRGVPEKRAEEIAARTVNKARARSGEAKNPSKPSKTKR